MESGNPLAYLGIGAVLLSALLTAIYMMSIVIRAFFPAADFEDSSLGDARDPGWMMLLPLFLFAAAIIYFGLHPGPIIGFLTDVANGLL